ncbi:hypothetical protein [Pseudomonas syringae group genomosp. 3]|uniref:Uncharacterized protein n=1 Tax=Pseudomonas syringae pv. primulae TaxID=251707 RepID=A0A3M5U3X3_9PSED|nr:hypothetical protein [Pseudomonas syringae group genomosp. 3]RMO77687.1 hypothetical protein ALQ36_00864 [Pseudomonas syringae pv. primulae]RMU40244.1 hypothetical protein ALP30_103222 [Pseudomonas syringae pv. primulae]
MKTRAKIEAFISGAAIFDPLVLSRFAAQFCPSVDDLFTFFIEEREVGRLAVQSGVVLPMYEIPEEHYLFRLRGVGDRPLVEHSDKVFLHSGIPLRVESGLLIVADLYALMDWDPEFFLNFRDQRHRCLGNADYLDVSQGLYSMSIAGLDESNGECPRLVYELAIDPVDTLPVLHEFAHFDDWDFAIKRSL